MRDGLCNHEEVIRIVANLSGQDEGVVRGVAVPGINFFGEAKQPFGHRQLARKITERSTDMYGGKCAADWLVHNEIDLKCRIDLLHCGQNSRLLSVGKSRAGQRQSAGVAEERIELKETGVEVDKDSLAGTESEV